MRQDSPISRFPVPPLAEMPDDAVVKITYSEFTDDIPDPHSECAVHVIRVRGKASWQMAI